MELKLVRDVFTNQSTLGRLYLDGTFECYTLEDPFRTGPKIPGNTCIPYGKYQVVLVPSPRFHKIMPRLLDVPGFDGILIHVGNSPADTDGCILVGQSGGAGVIFKSQVAWDELFAKLQAATDKISIEITK